MGTGFTAPTTRTLAKSPLWLSQLLGGENARVYEAAANQVRAIPHPPRMPDIDKLIQDAYTRIKNGQVSAKAAMTEIKPQVDAILATRGR
jgi:ABC-type glycerol-3-phosphate transport system substrate-binding protein